MFGVEWGADIATPFARLSHADAMASYGTDKPDLRFGLKLRDCSDAFYGTQFRLCSEALQRGHAIIGFADPGGAARGRRDGFTGMLAIHPSQIPIINAAFTPSAAEMEWARRVVDAFAADPQAGVLQMDGQMLDAPHLARAKNILGGTRDA